MTIDTIIAIVGPSGDACEVQLLRAADKAAVAHLKAHGGVLIDANTQDVDTHHDRFESLLKHSVLATPNSGNAEDDARNRQQGLTESAYYFGLALGLRIAGGGQ